MRLWLLGALAALVVAAPAAADGPVDPIPLALDAPASVASAPGHVTWFAVANPGPDAIRRVDLDGSDFDTTLAFSVGGDAHGDFDLAHPAAHEAIDLFFSGGNTTYLRVAGAEPADGGTIHIEVADHAAAGVFADTPATLELSGSAVSSISRALAEPVPAPVAATPAPRAGVAHAPAWWRLAAPATGPVTLDSCLSERHYQGGQLDVLDDTATAVLSTASTPTGCPQLTFTATAGTTYRVRLTPNQYDDSVVVLRALAAGTPPAVDLGDAHCADATCTTPVDVRAAPGTTVAAVDCRLDSGPWAPCARAADGTPQITAGFSSHTMQARATGSDGRSALFKSRLSVAYPTDIVPSPVAPGGPAPITKPAARPRVFRAPSARFTVGRRGTRTRSLTLPWVPAQTRITLRCAGRHCPFTTRATVARRGGAVSLTRFLRTRTLRPGTTLTLRLTARGFDTLTTRWRIRAHRPPARS